MQVFRLASCFFLQAQSSSPTSAPAAICSISTHFFRATPLFSLNVWLFSNHDPKSAIFALSTTPSQISETARTAGRCDRRGARTTPRLCPAFSPQRPKSLDFARFQRSPAFAASGFSHCRSCQYEHFSPTLPHVGATSGFLLLDGYALGWAAKAAQTADTGATGCDWRFGCALNLYFQ